jgi:hypothetical protein
MGEQVSKFEHKIKGTTTTEPKDLPIGFKVESERVPHETITRTSTGFNAVTLSEVERYGETLVRFETAYNADTVKRHLSPKDARALGVWLIEVAESHGVVSLRKVSTGGSTWYEIEKDWFVTAASFSEAKRIAAGEDRREFGYDNLDRLLRVYPSATVTYN